MDMWVKTHDGSLVNLSRMSTVYISLRWNSPDKYQVMADGQITSNTDQYESIELFVGTEDECKAALARLPMPIACDFSKEDTP